MLHGNEEVMVPIMEYQDKALCCPVRGQRYAAPAHFPEVLADVPHAAYYVTLI